MINEYRKQRIRGPWDLAVNGYCEEKGEAKKKGKGEILLGTRLAGGGTRFHSVITKHLANFGTLIAHGRRRLFFLLSYRSRFVRPCPINHQNKKRYPTDMGPIARQDQDQDQDQDDVAVVPLDVDNEADTDSQAPRVQSKDVQGLKYFERLLPLRERLHGEKGGRDKAGNRELFFDKSCMLLLLYMFNPMVTSLRAIAQASELEKVWKKLGCRRISLGSLSEASRVFDAEPLKEIIRELGEQVSPISKAARLSQINQTLTRVDGSIVSALPSLMKASLLKRTEGSGLVQ
ncbi:hypothetical protein CA13_52830 [Planctomycetes bacterium CA13]|uniref:Uncharacterized protein n=1 Tax=Novipirellula herctigrandis TaxID=2527986 RepID=A0A5C5Z916_9BACT|nr:hypothetical protein CA13_52830 [Planctomycetes bacterium CA13]